MLYVNACYVSFRCSNGREDWWQSLSFLIYMNYFLDLDCPQCQLKLKNILETPFRGEERGYRFV